MLPPHTAEAGQLSSSLTAAVASLDKLTKSWTAAATAVVPSTDLVCPSREWELPRGTALDAQRLTGPSGTEAARPLSRAALCLNANYWAFLESIACICTVDGVMRLQSLAATTLDSTTWAIIGAWHCAHAVDAD